MKITMETAKLLRLLLDNKNSHEKQFKAAMKAYASEVEKFLETQLLAIRENPYKFADDNRWSRMPQPPECNLEGYDKAIGAVRYHALDEIELPEETYNKWVNDEWEWSRTFKQSIAHYGVAK